MDHSHFKSQVLAIKVFVFLTSGLFGGAFDASVVWAQFNENCFVSILNRTAQVRPNGAWEILNLPSDFGPVRARATCLENGLTVRGQSNFFPITTSQTTGLQPFPLGVVEPIPVTLTVSAPLTTFTTAGATAQLTTIATLPDTTTVNVTASTSGTVYSSSNAMIASVNANGVVTAVSSGAVLMTARNEGAIGLTQIQVQLTGDSDGDGIPDDQELALGLDPNDPLDALDDADQDGLTAAQEIALGTNIFLADSDGDGIVDGEEVSLGADGFVTNPLLSDTDGDGVRDALEIATGSDPTDPLSLNLALALASLQVSPSAFVLTFNAILLSEATEQLTVTGLLQDGTTIDLTSSQRGTNYTSDDFTICNFSATDGLVLAGVAGMCLITVNNSGFVTTVDGNVQNFEPVALSFLDLPGTPNNVEVQGDYAYLASFSNGVQILDISNRQAPTIVSTIPSPQVWDVKIMGTTAYLAEGAVGGSRLKIVDVTDPLTPVLRGEVELPAFPVDLVVSGPLAYAAMREDGLQVIDITNAEAPRLLGTFATGNTVLAVAIDEIRQLAILADGSAGLTVIDVSNPSQPVMLGNTPSTGGFHRQIELLETLAFVANPISGLHVVDLTTPSSLTTLTVFPTTIGGELQDIALAGSLLFGAERTTFGNGVPIISTELPIASQLRGGVDFSTFASLAIGVNLAVDGNFVYLGAGDTFPDTNSRLYIGQYIESIDEGDQFPLATLRTPTAGQTIKEGSILPIIVEASDDISLQAVEFLVDGQVVFSDTTFPYQYDAPVPVGTTDFTVAARAIDLGGNQTLTADVSVTVQPDLLTTVIGTVVDTDGNQVSGAQVITAGGVSGITSIDGTFSLANVPTLFDSSASATIVTVNGAVAKGSSLLVPPVPQGTTDVGQFTIVAPDICEDECVPQ